MRPAKHPGPAPYYTRGGSVQIVDVGVRAVPAIQSGAWEFTYGPLTAGAWTGTWTAKDVRMPWRRLECWCRIIMIRTTPCGFTIYRVVFDGRRPADVFNFTRRGRRGGGGNKALLLPSPNSPGATAARPSPVATFRYKLEGRVTVSRQIEDALELHGVCEGRVRARRDFS